MTKLIRKGTFETNSSSAHSITVNSNVIVYDTIIPDENGRIIITGQEFGWDWFKSNDPLTKAAYAATSFQHNDHQFEILCEVIRNHTGATHIDVRISSDYESPYYGYIDHESYGIVPRSYDELKNFIFNKNSWLFGGNDNESDPVGFKAVPSFKADGSVDIPKPNSRLIIDKFKFNKEYTLSDEELTNQRHDIVELVCNGLVIDRNQREIILSSDNDDSDTYLNSGNRYFSFHSCDDDKLYFSIDPYSWYLHQNEITAKFGNLWANPGKNNSYGPNASPEPAGTPACGLKSGS